MKLSLRRKKTCRRKGEGVNWPVLGKVGTPAWGRELRPPPQKKKWPAEMCVNIRSQWFKAPVGIKGPAGAREGTKSSAGDVRVTLGPVRSVVHGSWHGPCKANQNTPCLRCPSGRRQRPCSQISPRCCLTLLRAKLRTPAFSSFAFSSRAAPTVPEASDCPNVDVPQIGISFPDVCPRVSTQTSPWHLELKPDCMNQSFTQRNPLQPAPLLPVLLRLWPSPADWPADNSQIRVPEHARGCSSGGRKSFLGGATLPAVIMPSVL